MADGYGPQRRPVGRAIYGLAPPISPTMVIPTTEAIFHGRASRQAEVGRRSLRFAFQVAAPVTSVSHYRGSGLLLCLSLFPLPHILPFLAGRIPADRSTRAKKNRRPEEHRLCCCSYCHSALSRHRGMNGCGPTALVRPDRGHRRRRDCARGGASEHSGCPTLRATGAELRPAVDLRGAFGNKVNHAVAGFGL